MKLRVASVSALALLIAAGAVNAQNRVSTRGRNLNISTEGSAQSCADLKVTSSNAEVARANETVTLQRSEAASLELNGVDRGVISVRGWNRGEYEVQTCKIAVAETQAAASQMLSAVSVSHSGGRFTFDGPATNDNGNWQIYFIVHAPPNANLDLGTRNGPVSIADVTGTIKARAVNGPLSIQNCSGNIDAQTTNGPISFSGDSGEVHLNAQNGPISVKLAKDIWSGSQLDARTVNGPVSLSMPAAFHSGVRVESLGHGPLSCNHQLCTGAMSTSNNDRHLLQLNGSTETVRVSTTNGPISVNGGNGKAEKIM